MRTLAAILLGLLLATSAHAEVMCISGPMQPQVIAGRRAQVAGSGGVIVAAGEKLPDWRFRDLNKVVRPRVTALAPGLAIYHPPPLPGTDVVLEDGNHSVIARIVRALTIEEPAGAPRVKAITATTVAGGRRAALAELAEKAPEHAVAIIVSRVERDHLVPLTWAQVSGNQPPSVLVWHTPYSCEATIPASIEPKVGERVVLTWIDDAGRVSEPSKSIVIAGASKGK